MATGQADYDATILRFPMIYGPRQVAPREWCIIRRILDGRRRIIVPDGGLKLERRGFVDNVAHAVLLAVDKGRESAGQIYNVGDETIWSLREWIEAIASYLNHECELVSMPFAVARPVQGLRGQEFSLGSGHREDQGRVGVPGPGVRCGGPETDRQLVSGEEAGAGRRDRAGARRPLRLRVGRQAHRCLHRAP